ncbi:sugar phosphorylase [bacterium]|nr:sugar phosphorylase [Akkermansiaceae bacterium]MDB4373953.1 sugar phosphorylase [Akkermansiaceae bacterium]MDB4407135.1 sugar phosphorylase [bacterium]
MSPLENLLEKVSTHLTVIYGEGDHEALRDSLVDAMQLRERFYEPVPYANHWSEKTVTLITYGDSILGEDKPLVVLKKFINDHLAEAVDTVHILPYFPWTSDDGFAVSDYLSVNPPLGDWGDIEAIATDYRLMSDLVVNHCSTSHEWFRQYERGEEPGASFFVEASPSDDLSAVTRPRTSPLLRPTGDKHVWCTFGHDQADLNFAEPRLLIELIKIIRTHLEHGVSIFRLDAIAFAWKEIGTNCINLSQTHELVRLFRTLIEHVKPDAVLITETNVPNRENLSYFGNFNEAHSIYNFSFPPLLLHGLTTGSCLYLRRWIMSMPPAMLGTTYFNFLASHDGIGLRPAEGLLSNEEIDELVDAMKENGGRVSGRTLPDGSVRPYEINISLYDAFGGNEDRFLCAHTILLALEGMPAFYIHSLLGTRNDYAKAEASGHSRHINRHQWDLGELETALDDPENPHARTLSKLKALIKIRTEQPAFHPNATQFTLHLGDEIFGFWRQSLNRSQNIFCLHNITGTEQTIPLGSVNLVATDDWMDLLSGEDLAHDTSELVFAPYQSMWLASKPKFLPY